MKALCATCIAYSLTALVDIVMTVFGVGRIGASGEVLVEANPVWQAVQAAAGKEGWVATYLLQVAVVLYLLKRRSLLARGIALVVWQATLIAIWFSSQAWITVLS
jgi:hypothetical protein